MDYQNGPFAIAAQGWLRAIARSQEKKNIRFQPEALEGRRFYCGPYDFFFNEMSSDKFFRMPRRTDGQAEIVVTVNKVAELVQIFGPNLYHRNPTRRATTRTVPPIDPNLFITNPQMAMLVQQVYQESMMEQMQDKAMGQIYETLLNVTPHKTDLKEHSRWAIDEMLITGLGLLVHDYTVSPATGLKTCGSYWRSNEDLQMDPDAKTIKDIRWASLSTTMATWEAERKFNLPPGTLKGAYYSANTVAGAQTLQNSTTNVIQPNMVRVHEVYSKMGAGGRLKDMQGLPEEARTAYELMGDFCYIVVVEGHPWPLNLPPWLFRGDNPWPAVKKAVAWPTPFWVEGAWPFTPFYVHTVPNDPWPLSHLTPGMGYLKFLNWVYAKLASKIAVTSRDLLFILAEASDEVKNAIKYGPDLTVVELQGMQADNIQKIIQQFQHQPWNDDIWNVIQMITKAFEDSTGLSELVYGQSARQMRSAAEADRKYDQVNVRPDDMANKVEDAMSACADREKWCSRWHYKAPDVHSLIGVAGAFAWQVLIESQPYERTLDLQMRVESDSSRKPNKSALQENLNQAMQIIAPPLFQAAQAGMLDPWNALVNDWGEAIGLPDIERYLLRMPPNVPVQEDPNRTADREAEKEIAKSKPKAA